MEPRALAWVAVASLACALGCGKKDKGIQADPPPDASTPAVPVECRDARVFEDGRVVASVDAGAPPSAAAGGRFEPRFVATAKAPRPRAQAVARAACSVTTSIRTCGGDAFVRQPGFQGTLVLSLDVVGAKLGLAMRLGGNANEMGVESCVLDALRKATFDADANGTTLLEVTWLPRGSAILVREHFTQVTGNLPGSEVREAVGKHHTALRHCFEDARARDAAHPNVLVMPKFVIDEAGKPGAITLDPASVKDQTLHACIVGVFASVRYPAPSAGKVEVVYPLELAWDLE